jgi:hypothetical protein
MKAVTLGTSTDDLFTLEVTCSCPSGRRRLPIRFSKALRNAIEELDPAPELMLIQYRCTDCKGIIQVRAKHLELAVPSA